MNTPASGTNPPPLSTTYVGNVVAESNGEEIIVTWEIGDDQWAGIGTITDDGRLFVEYTGAFTGTGTWTLQHDGSLVGTWQGEGDAATGTEDWTPR